MNCPKCGLPVALLDRDWNSTAVQHAKCPVNELAVLQSRLAALETVAERLASASRVAINTVECASLDPVTKAELPWHMIANRALAAYDEWKKGKNG